MRMIKGLRFTLLLPGLKAQTQKTAFRDIAGRAAPLCGLGPDVLYDLFWKKEQLVTSGIGQGVSVMDIRAAGIRKDVLVLGTFDHDIDFDALDGSPVDLFAAVISPFSDGPRHLQRLAAVTRLLRNSQICGALRDAKDEDTMRVLLMPSQRWMEAA